MRRRCVLGLCRRPGHLDSLAPALVSAVPLSAPPASALPNGHHETIVSRAVVSRGGFGRVTIFCCFL